MTCSIYTSMLSKSKFSSYLLPLMYDRGKKLFKESCTGTVRFFPLNYFTSVFNEVLCCVLLKFIIKKMMRNVLKHTNAVFCNLNILRIKYQSYPNAAKINAFELKRSIMLLLCIVMPIVH